MIDILEKITSELPSGLSSEAHVVAELYHQIKLMADSNIEIRLEHKYQNRGTHKCDIYLKDKEEYWIEVKAYLKCESVNTRSAKHTNTDKSSIVKAIRDLGSVDKGIKVIILYQDIYYNPRKHSWCEIEDSCNLSNINFLRREVY